MNKLKVITTALLCLLPAFGALAQGTPQVVTVPISNPEEQVTVEIDILSARIEVIGEERQDAQFEFTVADGRRQIITPSGAKPLTGAGYEMEIEEDDNYISVDTDWRANKVNITARVPRNADLILETVDDGEIIVRNIAGNLHLDNVNGPITASNISGSVIAESVNDAIDVSFDALRGDEAMSMSSINGNLRVAIPEDAGVELHLDSSMGEIYSDFEVEVRPSEPIVEREEDEDGVQVRVESVIIADINGGGPVIRLKTLHGDIQIAKSGN